MWAQYENQSIVKLLSRLTLCVIASFRSKANGAPSSLHYSCSREERGCDAFFLLAIFVVVPRVCRFTTESLALYYPIRRIFHARFLWVLINELINTLCIRSDELLSTSFGEDKLKADWSSMKAATSNQLLTIAHTWCFVYFSCYFMNRTTL